jgi:RNA polymerase sigma-70 factor (ECF subfamily)
LLRQLSAGDPAALREIVLVYFPILCRYAEKFLPDSFLAKDIVQETFVKLWQYQGTFETFQGLKSFLFVVTRNGCLNLQRGRAREEKKHHMHAKEEMTDAEAYDEIAWMEQLARINEAVMQMPEKMRTVFLLSFREGLSIGEIARRMNISNKTVRNQKYKSLIVLKGFFHGSRASFLLLLTLLK